VDVGAHHPLRFSNTYFFYRQGWRGINVDAMPGSMEPFKQIRPEDINLENAVSFTPAVLTYSIFNDPALNSFDEALSAERAQIPLYKIVDRVKIQTRTLADILDQYLPAGKAIDFLTVDVEGFDLQVLQSNNWTKYRPAMVLAEDTSVKDGLDHIEQSDVSRFLRSQSYKPFASTGFTVFYKKQE
jgi:FkbM family methyltransferase